MPVSLNVRDLTIRRGDAWVVANFEWRHSPGAVAWVIGANGAGKSSLVRVLAGRAQPSAGRVEREGGGAVGYYHPGMSLPPSPRASAFDVLMRALNGAPSPLAAERSLARKRIAALSTGEEKRLLLGGLLARPRPWLFLDEPYEHLSPDARTELTSRLVAAAASSVVLVATNQDVPDARGVQLRLHDGRIEVLA